MEQDNVKNIIDESNVVAEDQASWAESAKEELEDFIESQGVYLRQ